MVDAIEKTHGVRYNYGANYFPSDPGTGPDWAYGKLGVKVGIASPHEPQHDLPVEHNASLNTS